MTSSEIKKLYLEVLAHKAKLWPWCIGRKIFLDIAGKNGTDCVLLYRKSK